jgi:hypothetical protein
MWVWLICSSFNVWKPPENIITKKKKSVFTIWYTWLKWFLAFNLTKILNLIKIMIIDIADWRSAFLFLSCRNVNIDYETSNG